MAPQVEARADPAVELMLAAARSLARPQRALLSRALVRLVALENEGGQLSRRAEAKVRAIEALVDVATKLGRTPTTGDYTVVQRREQMRGNTLPSLSAVVRAFGAWTAALAAAGLTDPARPDELRRRRAHIRLRIGRYTDDRLIQCLRAAARELGRSPKVMEYAAWRRTLLNRQAVSHLRERDIPHHRTFYIHFESWPAALRAAGLAPRTAEHPPDGGWSQLV